MGREFWEENSLNSELAFGNGQRDHLSAGAPIGWCDLAISSARRVTHGQDFEVLVAVPTDFHLPSRLAQMLQGCVRVEYHY